MPVLWGSRSDFNLICEQLRLARDALSNIAFFAFSVFGFTASCALLFVVFVIVLLIGSGGGNGDEALRPSVAT